MIIFKNDPACPSVRVVKQLSYRVDGRAGNADACERVIPVRDRMLRYRRLDMTDGFFAVRHSIRVRPELRIIDDRAQPCDATKLAPQTIVRDPDHNRAICGLEGLIGTQRLMA
jgi:hypothetical protein